MLARFEGLRPDIRDTTNCLQTELSHMLNKPVAREPRSCRTCCPCNIVWIFNFFSVFMIDTCQECSNSETNFLFNFQCPQNCRLVKEPKEGARPQLLSQLVGKWLMGWHYILRMCRIK